jgi:cation:H+ antiporter
MTLLWIIAGLAGIAGLFWGAETFAKHLAGASNRLGVSGFALAILLAGAEPEELATAIAATIRKAPGLALGDAVGANITGCLLALGVGALIAPLPFRRKVLRYTCLGLPLGALASYFVWNGRLSRVDGAILVALYLLYIGAIWLLERKPPSLGEVGELEETASLEAEKGKIGKEFLLVIAGLIAMSVGATALVDSVRHFIHAESAQTVIGTTLLGFATGFELVVLMWSAARHGAMEAAIAGVVGSFSYNMTMTIGAAALVRPMVLTEASELHVPLLFMMGSLVLVILLSVPKREVGRSAGIVLVAAYGLFIAYQALHTHL